VLPFAEKLSFTVLEPLNIARLSRCACLARPVLSCLVLSCSRRQQRKYHESESRYYKFPPHNGCRRCLYGRRAVPSARVPEGVVAAPSHPTCATRSRANMTDRSASIHERHAHDMTDMGRWELSQRPHDNWGVKYPEAPLAPSAFAFAEQPALTEALGQLQLPKTRTSPVVTRTRVTRHGSNPHAIRPSSSGGDAMLPYRQIAPPRRAESYSHPTPLEDFRHSRRWPPSGYRQGDALDPREAEELICAGTSMFRGYCDPIPNTPEGYDRFFAVMDSEHQSRTDRGPVQADAYRYSSLNLTGASESEFSWLSLEQPCMAYAHGKSAGTTTLNYYVSKSGSSHPPVKPTGEIKPRKIKFLQILDRLQHLEAGLEEDVSPSLTSLSLRFSGLT
jgi:hypothetical protein